MELTPWDLQTLLLIPMQRGYLFPKPPNSAAVIRRLESSLSRTLHFYPLLAGRLSRTDNDDGTTTAFSIDSNNAGAVFVHAAADSVSLSDILDAAYVPPVVDSFFPLTNTINVDGVTKPLLAVQVTELTDGLFIACSMNHSVGDGNLLWTFLSSWAEICRGHDAVSKPPFLGRWFVDGRECPIQVPLAKIREEQYFGPQLELQKIFVFKKDKIAELKEKANAEMGTNQISSLQALMAHFWRSITRCRRPQHEEHAIFIFQLGCRARLAQMQFPEQYIGNAFLHIVVAMQAGELLERGVGHAALEINKVIGLETHETIKEKLESWAEEPDLISPTELGKISFVGVTGSPRFKVYEPDFGWGRPIGVRCGPGYKRDGAVALFPGAQEGDIEVHVCLLPETLLALENDFDFMGMLT